MKKIWRCTVCGYLHEGETPPVVCPVCHADASKFVLVTAEPEADQPPAQPPGLLREMLDTLVPHAISAHFPNALIPVVALFLGLFVLFGRESFATTAVSLLVVAVLSVVPTFVTGFYDWKTAYGGERAPIFRKKIVLAIVLLMLGLIALGWRWSHPQLLIDGGWPAWLFMALIVGMLACVTLLGHYGGILVFGGYRTKDGK